MKKNKLMAVCFGALAAVIYFASLAGYAYPGDSARLMALWRGLDASASPEFPLMALFVRLFGGGNLLAPVCGAFSVFALYSLVTAFVGNRVGMTSDGADDTKTRRGEKKERVMIIAGAVASLVFILSPAVRSAATHLEPRLFDFAWMLLPLLLSLPFYKAKRGAVWVYAPLAGVLAGLGLCDSALALAFLPFMLASVFFVARAQGRRPYVALTLNVFCGIATAFLACGIFGLGVSDHLVKLAAEMRLWRLTPGWLFVALFSTLPFVIALFSAKRSLSDTPGLVQWLFHLALTFVAILAVATPLSPSRLMEPYGVLPVASSAFAACVAAYLAAFWWLNRFHVVALASGCVYAFVLLVTCLWNLFVFDGDRGAFADLVAKKAIEDLGDRAWLVTDGALDSHLKLVAAKQGKELHLVSLARDLDEKYLKELSGLVERTGLGGEKNAELRATLSLGVLPFIQDWFASDPSAKKVAAVWGAPDLWVSAGATPVPEFLFFGADESRVPDWTAWKSFDTILRAPKGWGSYVAGYIDNPVDRLRLSLRRHLGFVANNRGVWLQDRHRDDDAWKMYELVLNEIDRDNICTIFNEMAMLGAKHPAAVAKKRDLERTLRAAVDDSKRRYVLWRLGSYYGYIRDPDVFVRLGHVWAKSGRPGDALSQIRRAIDFVPTDKRASLLNMMASLYASENNQAKSRRIYESILAKNSRDHDALVGMMRLELADGDAKKAMGYLERAVAVGGDGKRAAVEAALLAMMKNDLSGAASQIQRAIDKDTKDMQAWSVLAAVTLQQMGATTNAQAKAALKKKLEGEILPSMEKHAGDANDYHVQTTKGFLALQKDDADSRRAARDAFAIAAKSRPDVAATQDLVLGLDISLADPASAEEHAKDVLRRNRNAPLANYVMGSIALGRGDLGAAETFLRKAADARPPVALALNDLAEILRRTKRADQGEAYARRAVAVAPNLYVAWETLGSILMDLDRDFAEAESCIRKACELSREKNGRESDVRMLVSLARVQVKAGDKQHAKVTIRKVQRRINELSAEEKKEFEKVVQSAR
jgi:Tfp pilus assembly protein PilF